MDQSVRGKNHHSFLLFGFMTSWNICITVRRLERFFEVESTSRMSGGLWPVDSHDPVRSPLISRGLWAHVALLHLPPHLTWPCRYPPPHLLQRGWHPLPGAPEPDTIHIAKEIARRSGSTTVLKSDEYKGATRIITFYTDGSTRSVTLQDGTVIKFLHANK